MNHSSLLAAFLIAQLLSPGANAAPNLEVRADGDCPDTGLVTTNLLAIRPDDEWPPLVATLHMDGEQLVIALGQASTTQRKIKVSGDCTERARLAALVIAAWSGELPDHATSAPTLSVDIPAPLPAPIPTKPSAWFTELGFAGFYSMVGGGAPGGRIEAGHFRRDGWLGLRASATYQAEKALRVDIGLSRYSRALFTAAAVFRLDSRWGFLSTEGGLVGALTRANGGGYTQNLAARSLNLGLEADGRAGLRTERFRIWAEARAVRWLRTETIHVDRLSGGALNARALPTWDAHLGLGVGILFD